MNKYVSFVLKIILLIIAIILIVIGVNFIKEGFDVKLLQIKFRFIFIK